MGLGRTPNRDLIPFYRKLGAEFDCFARRGTMLIHKPIHRLIGGFHFDPFVGSREKRWCCYFVQPLFVPEVSVTLSWGWRIPWADPKNPRTAQEVTVHGNYTQIQETIKVMVVDGLPRLGNMLELRGFYNTLSSGEFDKNTSSYFLQEALAYTAILLREELLAVNHIRNGLMILSDLDRDLDTRPNGLEDFEISLQSRFQLVRQIVDEHGIDGAMKQLDYWQQYTVDQLNINDLIG